MRSLAIRHVSSDQVLQQNARGLTLSEFENIVCSLGEKRFRAGQITTWIYKRRAVSFQEMTDLSQEMRARLETCLSLDRVSATRIEQSRDGTRKLLLTLEDGEKVECVLIPDGKRLTLCISTQAGCAMGCIFCFTGITGFKRNLAAHEMIDQILAATEFLREGEKITNFVLMGMGEPLTNYSEVKRFLTIATAKDCLDISSRRITLSTVGIPNKLEALGREFNDINLAVSLHATIDEMRNFLMPVNKRYTLKRLIETCRTYSLPKRKRITIEYVLLKGFNDSIEDAKRLSKLLKGIRCKINLIPFNPFPGARFEPPSDETIRAFKSQLVKAHFTATVRASKGSDISAACGQLSGL
jgi:23S rRNA (adenine2503-C2)-methyltransferase